MQALQQLIEPYIIDNIVNDIGKPFISKMHICLMGLWLLISEESNDCVAERFGVTKSCCDHSFKSFCSAILLNKKMFINWPEDKIHADQIINKFNDEEIMFPNICGVIGSTHIQRLQANCSKTLNDNFPDEILLQCVCDANGIFLDCFVLTDSTNSTNTKMFSKSLLKKLIESNEYYLNPNTYLIGDGTYALQEYLLVPFNQPILTEPQIRYNQILMKKQAIITKTFLRYKERFSKLKNMNHFQSQKIVQCIDVACALHNFCLRQNDTFYLEIDAAMENDEKPTRYSGPSNERRYTGPDAIAIRDKIVAMLNN